MIAVVVTTQYYPGRNLALFSWHHGPPEVHIFTFWRFLFKSCYVWCPQESIYESILTQIEIKITCILRKFWWSVNISFGRASFRPQKPSDPVVGRMSAWQILHLVFSTKNSIQHCVLQSTRVISHQRVSYVVWYVCHAHVHIMCNVLNVFHPSHDCDCRVLCLRMWCVAMFSAPCVTHTHIYIYVYIYVCRLIYSQHYAPYEHIYIYMCDTYVTHVCVFSTQPSQVWW